MEKTFTVIIKRAGNFDPHTYVTEKTGTLEDLVNFFGATLTRGHFMNWRVSLAPKSIKSLVNSVNKSYEALNQNSWITLK